MHKKLMMACMAIAAFAAFVIAPAAQASPALTDEGVLMSAGTSITGKNTGVTKFTGAFSVECSTAHLTGTLTENTGSSIKGEIPAGNAQFTGTGTSGDCTSALGNVAVTVNSKLCISMSKGSDAVTTTGCGTAPVTFTLEITGTGPCRYETASVSGTATTGAATVNVEKQPAKGESTNGIFCPGEGSLDMDFDLYTTGSTPGGAPGPQLTLS